MKKHVTKYYILLLLAIIFAAPGITAYLFYQHPTWLDSSKVNKGTLLNPPVVLQSLDKQSKWRIIFWSPGVCEKTCLKQLDVLARIRLALGRKLYQVDQWLILGDQAPSMSDEINIGLKEQDFHVTQLSSVEITQFANLPSNARVFIANPDNYLVLSYPSSANPNDIYKDLTLLLNTTENKNG